MEKTDGLIHSLELRARARARANPREGESCCAGLDEVRLFSRIMIPPWQDYASLDCTGVASKQTCIATVVYKSQS